MSKKIDVESGNPYRDNKGHFGTSPDQALQASFEGLKGKSFVPKDGKGKKGTSNKDLIASKADEAKDKLEALRKGDGPDASDSSWKASGTQAEAEAFSKDSAIKDTIFHGTTAVSSSSISEKGFDVSKSISDKMFGDGVYLAGDKETADWYAGKAAGANGEKSVIEMKVNVKNPYIEDMNDFSYEIGEYSVSKFSYDMYEWGIKNKKWSNAKSYQNKVDKQSNYNKFTREFANHLMETHDAIVQRSKSGIDIMVVKDPKNIMVIKNG